MYVWNGVRVYDAKIPTEKRSLAVGTREHLRETCHDELGEIVAHETKRKKFLGRDNRQFR